jgi:hypothetical protein
MAFETFAKSALLNDCIVLAMDALNSEQYKYSTKIVSKCWEADRLVVEVACYSAAGRWRMDCSICFPAVSTTGELARNAVHESIVRVQRID